MKDLINIWLNAPSPSDAELERLGVSFYASQKVGGLRMSNVRYGYRHLEAMVLRPGTNSGSEPALILPVFIDPPSIWRAVENPALIDLVAFDPQNPNRWQTARGEGVMLGEAAYWEAVNDDLELPVFRNPLEWVHAAGAGVFSLDGNSFNGAVIGRPFLRLVSRDTEHGEGMEAQLMRCPRVDLPEIRVAT